MIHDRKSSLQFSVPFTLSQYSMDKFDTRICFSLYYIFMIQLHGTGPPLEG